MKRFFLLILAVSMLSGQLLAQSGMIYYTNGRSLHFSEIYYLQGKLTDTKASFKDGKMRINYENSVREVPFDKIKSIEIITWKPNCPTCDQLFDVNLDIQTKTGVYIHDTNHILLEYVNVYINDELTGEQVDQKVFFGANGKKNISKIVIY